MLRQLKIRGTVFFGASMFFVGLLVFSGNSPTVQWQPSSLDIPVFAGGIRTVVVELETQKTIRDPIIFITPSIRNFVAALTPLEKEMKAGEHIRLLLQISSPPNAKGTFGGTIHVREKRRSLAKPLPVVIKIVEPVILEETLNNFLIQQFGTTTIAVPETGVLELATITPEIASLLETGSNLPAVFRLGSFFHFTSNLIFDLDVADAISRLLPLVGQRIRVQDLIDVNVSNAWHRDNAEDSILPKDALGVTLLPRKIPFAIDTDGNGIGDVIIIFTDDNTHIILNSTSSADLTGEPPMTPIGIPSHSLLAVHELTHAMIFRTKCGGEEFATTIAQEPFVSQPFLELLIFNVFNFFESKNTIGLNAKADAILQQFPNAQNCMERLDLTRPTPVTLAVPTNVTTSTLTLSWSPNTDRDFTSYKIFRSTSSPVTLNSTLLATITTSSVITFADAGLPSGTRFFYKVFVFDKPNLSSGSNEVSDTTLFVPIGLADTPWPMFHHDARHTGQSALIGITEPIFQWRFTAPSESPFFRPLGFVGESSIGIDDTIYVPNLDGFIYAINFDGTSRWRFFTGIVTLQLPTPAIAADGTIYIAGSQLSALNPDGRVRWNFMIRGSSPVIDRDGTIYTTSEDTVYAINPDGSLKWATRVKGFPGHHAAPAIFPDGTIAVRMLADLISSHISLLDPLGNILKTFIAPGGPSPIVITSNDLMIINTFGGSVEAYNRDGILQWSRTLVSGEVFSDISISKEDTIYVGIHRNGFAGPGRLIALTRDGEVRWVFVTPAPVNCTGAIDDSGTIYIGTNGGDIFAITSGGLAKWQLRLLEGIDITSCPITGGEGRIYAGSLNGHFYAISQR